MTGLKDFNRDSFYLAELALKEQGHEVRNPACLPTDWTRYEDYVEVSLVMLGQCEAAVFLPGSDKSKGAQIEKDLAERSGIPDHSQLLADVWDALNVAYIANKGVA
tara:strand:- start:1564 stop:1881 length:318 start_codon:yes stop_codon:yes gene_type:complete